MGEGQREIQASNYEMSKSQKLKAQHKEDSQWYCNSDVTWHIGATLKVNIA